MGRGLSPLQTTILSLAYQNDLTMWRGRVTARSVYKALYGWEQTRKHFVHPQGDYFFQVWDVEAIGAATFHRRATVVSRSLRRLVQRGLLKPKARRKHSREWEWVLTDAGAKVARQLSVNRQGGPVQGSPHFINR